MTPHCGLVGDPEPVWPNTRSSSLYPSCLVLGVQDLECSSLTPFSHHQTTVYLQGGINSFWPCSTLGILFISPVGKNCSQEMTMSKLVPECGIPDIRKPRGRYVFGGGEKEKCLSFTEVLTYYKANYTLHCPSVNTFPLQQPKYFIFSRKLWMRGSSRVDFAVYIGN